MLLFAGAAWLCPEFIVNSPSQKWDALPPRHIASTQGLGDICQTRNIHYVCQ